MNVSGYSGGICVNVRVGINPDKPQIIIVSAGCRDASDNRTVVSCDKQGSFSMGKRFISGSGNL